MYITRYTKLTSEVEHSFGELQVKNLYIRKPPPRYLKRERIENIEIRTFSHNFLQLQRYYFVSFEESIKECWVNRTNNRIAQ